MRTHPSSHSDTLPNGKGRSARPTGRDRPKRRIFPLGIRVSLVLAILAPIAVGLALASSVVAQQVASRNRAITVRQSSLTLDALLRARIDIYAEYVPSAAIVAARLNHLSETQLDTLLGINFQAKLVRARKIVDQQSVLGTKGTFGIDRPVLLRLRHDIDKGTASSSQVESFFNVLGVQIDATWLRMFSGIQSNRGSDTHSTSRRLTALDSSFQAFTSGLGEESLRSGASLESLLVAGPTAPALQSLILSNEKFEAATSDFPGALGPHATTAWIALARNPLSADFETYVQLGITSGLSHAGPSVPSSGIAAIARSEVEWADSLTNLVLASSEDLRTATVGQTNASTSALEISLLLITLIVLLSIGGVLMLGQAVRRPIAKLGAAFESLRQGELELPHLKASGPREIALASNTFNEMASTLRGVQAQAIALSNGHLDDPALQVPLPGRMGEALQSALSNLHISIQASEVQREELFERATRDALTRLLNRGAALEALNIDLAGARRSRGELALTVLFIDLDDLKKINDSLGHEGGDDAIVAMADVLRATTRSSDVVSRYGGDEFVVGWLATPDPVATAHLATRISELVAASVVRTGNRSLTLGCSIGVAVSRPSDITVLTLIERADHALYEAKKYGRGQVRWFEKV
jgi:diguanylate cyclase (GGDEF)-like protein